MVRPRTRYFCTSKIKTKPGIIADVPDAAIRLICDPASNREILTGIVLIELVKKTDNKNSVHENIKHNTAVAAMPPRTVGSRMYQKD